MEPSQVSKKLARYSVRRYSTKVDFIRIVEHVNDRRGDMIWDLLKGDSVVYILANPLTIGDYFFLDNDINRKFIKRDPVYFCESRSGTDKELDPPYIRPNEVDLFFVLDVPEEDPSVVRYVVMRDLIAEGFVYYVISSKGRPVNTLKVMWVIIRDLRAIFDDYSRFKLFIRDFDAIPSRIAFNMRAISYSDTDSMYMEKKKYEKVIKSTGEYIKILERMNFKKIYLFQRSSTFPFDFGGKK